MLETFTILILAAHLLAMNLASAAPLACVWIRRRHSLGVDADALRARIGLRLAWWSLAALGFGIVSGALIVFALPTEQLWAALARFPPNAYWFAGAELLFSFACLTLFIRSWKRSTGRLWLIALAVMSSTNLLYHFPPFMAVIGRLAVNKNWSTESIIDRHALLGLMKRPEVLALSIHFVVSSLAVAVAYALWLLCRDHEESLAEPARTTFAKEVGALGLLLALLQLPVGLWLLASLPNSARTALMGGVLLASLTFLAALAGVIVLLQRLFAVAMGEVDRRLLVHVWVLTCAVVVLMTASLRLSRM